MAGLSRSAVSNTLDTLFDVFKWPIGVCALLLLPSALVAMGKLLFGIAAAPKTIIAFAIGATGYWILWRFLLRRREVGSYFSTLEHELTHALFALLTLHPVTAIRASWRGDGVMQYLGKGNWLISIAPYYFPTLSFALIALFWLLPGGWRVGASVLLGVTLSYHVTSTWRETHADQPDLQKVRYAFAMIFLPTANLLCLGLVIAFAHDGGKGMATFLKAGWAFTEKMALALVGAG